MIIHTTTQADGILMERKLNRKTWWYSQCAEPSSKQAWPRANHWENKQTPLTHQKQHNRITTTRSIKTSTSGKNSKAIIMEVHIECTKRTTSDCLVKERLVRAKHRARRARPPWQRRRPFWGVFVAETRRWKEYHQRRAHQWIRRPLVYAYQWRRVTDRVEGETSDQNWNRGNKACRSPLLLALSKSLPHFALALWYARAN